MNYFCNIYFFTLEVRESALILFFFFYKPTSALEQWLQLVIAQASFMFSFLTVVSTFTMFDRPDTHTSHF